MAVSEKASGSDDGSVSGRDNEGGSAKSFELRSKLAAGDRRAAVIAAKSGPATASLDRRRRWLLRDSTVETRAED